MRRKGIQIAVSTALLLVTLMLVSGQAGNTGCWVDREEIYIYGDEDFTYQNGVVAGCGTQESPYVIEGWRIVVGRADYGINIEHTTRPFVIRNCVVIGGSGAAVRLGMLSHGTVEGCQLLQAERGILIENASSNTIAGNLISENRRGALPTLGSWGNIFSGNTFIANGLGADDPYAENHWHWAGIGNYWSDYGGDDCNGDGIGDTAYEPVNDESPLMAPPASCPVTPLIPPCGIETHPTQCGQVVGTPCYALPQATAPCGVEGHATDCSEAVGTPCHGVVASQVPTSSIVPCGTDVACPHTPACPTTSCPTIAACPPTICNPCVTLCEDQILTCTRTAVTLTSDVSLGGAGCAPCNVRWSKDGEVISAERNISVTEPGIYTVSVTGADGCSVSDSVAVFQDVDVPTVTAGVRDVLTCAVCEVEVFAQITGGRPPYTVEWKGPGASGPAIGCEASAWASAPGTYTVTVTGANGCVASDTVVVEQDIAQPVVQATSDGMLTCETTSVTLTADVVSGREPYTYTWSKPGVDLVGTGASVVVGEPGTYTVAVTGCNGCTGLASVTVSEDANPPTISASVNGTITCAVKEVALSAAISGGTPPYEIAWLSPGKGIVGDTASIRVSDPGTYTVTATGANGCWSSQEVVVDQAIAPPVVDAGPDQMMTLQIREVTLTATISDCAGSCSIEWRNMLDEVVGTTESITVDRAGLYHVTATNLATGCSATDEVAVGSDLVSQVMLKSTIEGLAVFGQLLHDGVPIPGTAFMFQVGSNVDPVAGEAEVSSMAMMAAGAVTEGVVANGAEVNYIIPTNAIVRFTIHKNQFILGKKYWLLHLPTDPEGDAAISFF